MLTKGNPNWQDGKNPNRYKEGNGRAFRAVRKMAMFLDNHECVICTSMENLHGHHVDGNAQNNCLTNIVTLCQSCHMTLHGAEREKPPRLLWPELKLYGETREYSIFRSKVYPTSSPTESSSITA